MPVLRKQGSSLDLEGGILRSVHKVQNQHALLRERGKCVAMLEQEVNDD